MNTMPQNYPMRCTAAAIVRARCRPNYWKPNHLQKKIKLWPRCDSWGHSCTCSC